MNNYSVICIDMFQTLVNIGDRGKLVWKQILREDYSDESLDLYAKLVSQKVIKVINKFHEDHSIASDFSTLREIFRDGLIEVFEETKALYNPELAADIIMREHNKADWYEDSLEFLKWAKEDYKVCLVSDADYDMVDDKTREFEFDMVVISEEIKSYKKNKDGRMIKHVLNHFGVSPEEVLHIGDSSSDVVGASSLGIDTCWINRHETPKYFDIDPTYSVKSLLELKSILLQHGKENLVYGN